MSKQKPCCHAHCKLWWLIAAVAAILVTVCICTTGCTKLPRRALPASNIDYTQTIGAGDKLGEELYLNYLVYLHDR